MDTKKYNRFLKQICLSGLKKMALEHSRERAPLWTAIVSLAPEVGCTTQTLSGSRYG